MSQLLVSVRSVAEAQVALASAVRIIDIKEPAAGSLGMADVKTIAEISHCVGGERQVSVALGELYDAGSLDPDFSGIDYAKIGLSKCVNRSDWQEVWKRRCAGWPESVQRVAVAYADASIAESPTWRELLPVATELNCAAFLIDTFDKRRGRLMDWLSMSELREASQAIHARGMRFAVAGSLGIDEISVLSRSIHLDLFAVRTAACAGGRNGRVDAAAIHQLSARLPS